MAKERKAESIGSCFFNKGTDFILPFEKYVLDRSRSFYLFDIIPMGAVRMSNSDRWKTNPFHKDVNKRQRKSVTKYFSFKNTLIKQSNELNYKLTHYLDAVYFIPMPDSWSQKKKELMNGMPHEQKPDTDNITKAIKDTMLKNDSKVWFESCQKRWAYKGSILIFK